MTSSPEVLDRMERQMEDNDQVRHLQEALDLIGTGVFHHRNPLFQAAITHLLVLLKDVAMFLRHQRSAPAVPNDHLPEGVRDLTDHIAVLRNAACHQTSGTHLIGAHTFTRNVAWGRGAVGQVDNVSLVSEFDDDVAVFFGTKRFYVKRHGIRAIDNAAAILGHRRDGMRLINLPES